MSPQGRSPMGSREDRVDQTYLYRRMVPVVEVDRQGELETGEHFVVDWTGHTN